MADLKYPFLPTLVLSHAFFLEISEAKSYVRWQLWASAKGQKWITAVFKKKKKKKSRHFPFIAKIHWHHLNINFRTWSWEMYFQYNLLDS